MTSPLLKHTCSIVQAGTTTSYNQTVSSWTSGTTTTANVACLLQPGPVIEQATGATIGTHRAWLEYGDVPASLKVAGAEKNHRLTQWAVGGVVRDAGPFDVVQIVDAAGLGHHLELILKRVAS